MNLAIYDKSLESIEKIEKILAQGTFICKFIGYKLIIKTKLINRLDSK